jgi:outer membrane protein assembly factor BamB
LFLLPVLLAGLVFQPLLQPRGFAEEWSRFRGPNGTGISADTGFPIEFGPGKNLHWRTAVQPGKSSPVLTARHVFLTGFAGGKLLTQCFDRATGKLLWERGEARPRQEDVNKLNHPAAITPVTDGENIYVFFKDLGLLSYDPSGALRWRAPLGPFTSSMGLGASPILAGDAVILLADQRDNSWLAAFDRRNGEIRWKVAREEFESWGTPMLYTPAGAPPQILTASRGWVAGHALDDGRKTMRLAGISPTIVASPVLDHDTLYIFGYGADASTPYSQPLSRYDKNHDGRITPEEYGDNAVMVAIGKYIGNGDLVVTEEKWSAWQQAIVGPSRMSAVRLERDPAGKAQPVRARELWHLDKNFTGVVPSPLLYQGVLFVIRNGGIMTSYDPVTGKEIKTGRLPGALGGYSASPVAAEGHIYLASEEGKVTVLKAAGVWESIASNNVGEGCYATPALSQGEIFVRSADALYCFAVKH